MLPKIGCEYRPVAHGAGSGYSTFGTGCHNKSDNRLDIRPILGQVSAEGRKFKQSTKAAIVGPALDRC